MNKIVYIVSVSMTVRFLRGQLSALRAQGFEVIVISSPGEELSEVAAQEGVKIYAVPIEREISLRHDFITVWQLYMILRRERPSIVNASTPKAGLLGMIAAWLARISVRVYQVRGLRLETTTGFKRWLLNTTERIAAACAQWVVCNSPSLAEVYVAQGLAAPAKVLVLGAGSSNGVHAEHFLPHGGTSDLTTALRKKLMIPVQAPIIGFVGRLTRDKGIVELVEAFDAVRKQMPEAYLLLVGAFEPGDPVPPELVAAIEANPQIVRPGFVADPAPYYHLMDVLAFPSYREGLPNVPLEAAVAGIPTVGFRATGVVDAVQDGETGFLVPVGSTSALADALLLLLQDRALRQQMGATAQTWVLTNFRQSSVWQRWVSFYQQCLHQTSYVTHPSSSMTIDEQVR